MPDPVSASASVFVRPATFADAEPVARLLRELGAHGVMDEAEAARRLQRGQEEVLLAGVGDQVGGLVAIKSVLYFGHAEPVAHITALVTDASVRRAGLARALVEASIDWTRSHGCVSLELMCGLNPAREAAHEFYPAMGVQRIAYCYSMPVTGSSASAASASATARSISGADSGSGSPAK